MAKNQAEVKVAKNTAKQRVAAIVAALGGSVTKTQLRQIVALISAGTMDGGRTKENVAMAYAKLTGKEYSAGSVPGMVSGLVKFATETAGVAEDKLPPEFDILGGGRGRKAEPLTADALNSLLESMFDGEEAEAA